jgi:hypothetical protein
MSRLTTTMPIPTRSRMTPALWMLNPDACAETAYFIMAPTTTSTMPNTMRPMPEFLFMADYLRRLYPHPPKISTSTTIISIISQILM